MIYTMFTFSVPRGKVNEILEFLGKEVFPRDQELASKVGGKIVGVWSTVYGNVGEITGMAAWPSLDARQKFMDLPKDEKCQKVLAKWMELTPNATSKAMRPAPFSPLQ